VKGEKKVTKERERTFPPWFPISLISVLSYGSLGRRHSNGQVRKKKEDDERNKEGKEEE
jgi:hypothetical protein